jgi:hypothetical protein
MRGTPGSWSINHSPLLPYSKPDDEAPVFSTIESNSSVLLLSGLVFGCDHSRFSGMLRIF